MTFTCSSTCFGRSPAHHQELNDCSSSLWFYRRIVLIAVLRTWSGRLSPVRPRTQHGYHHDTKVKPDAATAVIELLTMSGRTPETCWAANKRQDNKLKNCSIWLVIYLNYSVTSVSDLQSWSQLLSTNPSPKITKVTLVASKKSKNTHAEKQEAYTINLPNMTHQVIRCPNTQHAEWSLQCVPWAPHLSRAINTWCENSTGIM